MDISDYFQNGFCILLHLLIGVQQNMQKEQSTNQRLAFFVHNFCVGGFTMFCIRNTWRKIAARKELQKRVDEKIANWKLISELDSDEWLDLSNMGLTFIPELPANVTSLYLCNNKITELKNIPKGLTRLNVNENLIQRLENLPETLTDLMCEGNKLYEVPALPTSLKTLYLAGNSIYHIETLPADLEILMVKNNELESLPPLPRNLKALNVNGNPLTSLPELPTSLEYLSINRTRVKHLENLPAKVALVRAKHSCLETVDFLPESVISIECQGSRFWERFEENCDPAYIRSILEELKRESEARCRSRNSTVQDELLATVWNPECDYAWSLIKQEADGWFGGSGGTKNQAGGTEVAHEDISHSCAK